jgi:asparagine synthase (glutamine-hydrolysing)
MCGIAGIATVGSTPDAGRIERMVEALAHRGPDHSAVQISSRDRLGVGLGYRRLSIVDLSAAGNQPMSDETGDHWLVYNGELYNHLALREALERVGHRYRSRSDTETIAHAYEEWGLSAFDRFDSMFAVAIHDRRNERLVLARDRRGIKPLYYTWDGRTVVFASELKALVADGSATPRIDPTALWLYLCLGYVPSPHCIVSGVQKLEPGHALIVDRDGLRTHRFSDREPIAPPRRSEIVPRVRETVEAAIRKQLMSDVPIGVLLSGGLDSSIVAAIAARYEPGRIHTFSAGYRPAENAGSIDARYLEDAAVARTVAARLRTEHHEVEIENATELRDRFRALIYQLDEPMVEPVFLTTDRLAAAAHETGVPVLLTGDGADELFGGYDRYFAARRLEVYRSIPGIRSVLPLIGRARGLGSVATDARELRYLLEHPSSVDAYIRFSTIYRPEQALAVIAAPLRSQVDTGALASVVQRAMRGAEPFVDQMARADLALWVGEHFDPRLDRVTMAHSVEARVPFQDDDVVGLGLSLGNAQKSDRRRRKRVLLEAFADVLPDVVLKRPKRSFQAPGRAWLEGSLASDVRRLSDRADTVGDLFEPELVRTFAASWGHGTPGEVFAVSALLIAATWSEIYLAPASSVA